MKKFCFISLLLATVLFAGCSLAIAGEEAHSEDQLVGVFLTREHLNLFDLEGYFRDNSQQIFSGETIQFGDAEAYQQRLYGELENGIYHFGDLEGILFLNMKSEESSFQIYPDNAIGDSNIRIEQTDAGALTELEGTVYIRDDLRYVSFFFNPVYREAGGKFYLTAGTGTSMNLSEGENSSMSHTLTERWKTTGDAETQTQETVIQVHIQAVCPADRYTVFSMSDDHKVLSREEYSPETIPEIFVPADGTAYVLVESSTARKNGQNTILRTLSMPKDSNANFIAYIPGSDGVCRKETVKISW